MGRIKAEERVLSYHDKGRCWRKFYAGTMYYLDPRGVEKSNDRAYRKAVQNWQRRKAEISIADAEREAKSNPSIVTALKLADALRQSCR